MFVHSSISSFSLVSCLAQGSIHVVLDLRRNESSGACLQERGKHQKNCWPYSELDLTKPKTFIKFHLLVEQQARFDLSDFKRPGERSWKWRAEAPAHCCSMAAQAAAAAPSLLGSCSESSMKAVKLLAL